MIKKTGRYHVIVINLLVALALTLLVNFSYFVTGNEMRGHRPPPFFTVEPSFVIFRLFYFYVMVALLVMLNTVKGALYLAEDFCESAHCGRLLSVCAYLEF